MIVEISENVYWDNSKGFNDQDYPAQEYAQKMIDNIEPTIFVDEHMRPINIIWIDGKFKLSQTVVYKNEGTHKMSWIPLKDTLSLTKL